MKKRSSSSVESSRSAESPAGAESRAADSARSEQNRDASGSEQIRETVAHDEIARRAHELWEQDGRPEGRQEAHWLQAEKQLRGSSFQNGAEQTAGGSGDDARSEAKAIKASAERRAAASSRN